MEVDDKSNPAKNNSNDIKDKKEKRKKKKHNRRIQKNHECRPRKLNNAPCRINARINEGGCGSSRLIW